MILADNVDHSLKYRAQVIEMIDDGDCIDQGTDLTGFFVDAKTAREWAAQQMREQMSRLGPWDPIFQPSYFTAHIEQIEWEYCTDSGLRWASCETAEGHEVETGWCDAQAMVTRWESES